MGKTLGTTMSQDKLRKIGRLKNKEIYYKLFEEKYQGKLTLLKWIDCNHPITVKCNECGKEYEMDFSYAIRRKSNLCYTCGRKKFNEGYTRTTKDFQDKLDKKSNGLYSIVGEYRGFNQPVTIKCNNCGEEKVIRQASQFLAYCKSCLSCRMTSKNYSTSINKSPVIRNVENSIEIKDSKSYEVFYERFNKLYGDKFSLVEVKDSHSLVTIKCNDCNNIFDFSYEYINRGKLNKCPYCKPSKFNEETYQNKLNETFHGLFTLLSEYKNGDTPITLKCNNCGHEFNYSRPSQIFFQKHGCTKCKMTIEEYSKKMNNSNKKISYHASIPDIVQNNRNNTHSKKSMIFNIDTSYIEKDKEIFTVDEEVKNHKKSIWLQRKLDEKYGEKEFTVVTKYERSNKPVKIRHNKCGTVIEIIPYSVLYKNPNNDTICFRCFKDEELKEGVNDDKKVIDETPSKEINIPNKMEALAIEAIMNRVHKQEEESKEDMREKRPLQEVIKDNKEEKKDIPVIKPILGKDIISFIENNCLLEGEVIISGATASKGEYNAKILGIDMNGNIIVK